MAYAGGIWFFISQVLIGPPVKNFIAKRQFVEDIGEEAFEND